MSGIQAINSKGVFCADCGFFHSLKSGSDAVRLECQRCGSTIFTNKLGWIERCFALSVAGVVLFILSNVFSFLGLEAAGLIVESNLITGVLALINRDQWLLASLLLLFIFIIPLIELTGFCYLLSAYFLREKFSIQLPGIRQILKIMFFAKPWSMLEIFLIGVLVTTIKLGDIATLVWGPSSYAFIATVIVLTYLQIEFNKNQFWNWYNNSNLFYIEGEPDPGNQAKTFSDCHCCRAKISESVVHSLKHCPRCLSHVHIRTPRSIEFSLALTLAAIILYFPANLLPIMVTTQLGQHQEDTILSGVIHLAHMGSWLIAIVVFVASVFVPLAKIFALTYLNLSVIFQWHRNLRSKTILYRLVEFIGRWSMIDVFVVTILVALVQFGVLANIEPAGATLAFAGVVILTMLAAEIFDPRLLWDAKNDNE